MRAGGLEHPWVQMVIVGFSVIQVKGVTDKKEIKDIIDLIQGTLSSGGYYLNNYRLNDGNLELKVEY